MRFLSVVYINHEKKILRKFERGLIFPMVVKTRISLKTSLRNYYQDLIRSILKENTCGVMDTSDSPGKTKLSCHIFS